MFLQCSSSFCCKSCYTEFNNFIMAVQGAQRKPPLLFWSRCFSFQFWRNCMRQTFGHVQGFDCHKKCSLHRVKVILNNQLADFTLSIHVISVRIYSAQTDSLSVCSILIVPTAEQRSAHSCLSQKIIVEIINSNLKIIKWMNTSRSTKRFLYASTTALSPLLPPLMLCSLKDIYMHVTKANHSGSE